MSIVLVNSTERWTLDSYALVDTIDFRSVGLLALPMATLYEKVVFEV